MPKAVAILEGNSDGLVKSIKKAKDEMLSMEAGGKTLSRQLKDVATEADKAAGSLVHRIGGPTAIKAIGAIGIGMTAANTALSAFSSSMSAFASTQGEKGAKAMADLDMALNKMQGQLFTAVMGTDDLDTAMQDVMAAVNLASVAFQALLLPITGLSKLVRFLGTDFKELNGVVIEASDSLDALASKKRAEGLSQNAEGIESLRVRLMQLKGETGGLLQLEIKRDIQKAKSLRLSILDSEAQADALAAAAVVVANQAEIQKKANEKHRQYIQSLGEEKLSRAQIAEGAKIYNDEVLLQGQALMAKELEKRKGISEANQTQLAEVDEQIKSFEELAKAGASVTATGPSSSTKRAAEDAKAAAKELGLAIRFQIRGVTEDISAEPAKALARSLANAAALTVTQNASDLATAKNFAEQRAKVFGDATSTQVQMYMDAKTTQEIADIEAFNAARQRAIEEHDLSFNLHQDALAWAEEERQKKAAAHKERVDELTAEFQEYGKLAGQQLAEGKKAAKVAEDLARKAIGGQISALGDQAMAKAAFYAAEFNPLAIPMAAAGVAAYTAAAALGSTAKKATASTPASVAPAQAAPVNTSFNLRVDAAFADGESIARQFAMMQQAAQRRGLVPVGA